VGYVLAARMAVVRCPVTAGWLSGRWRRVGTVSEGIKFLLVGKRAPVAVYQQGVGGPFDVTVGRPTFGVADDEHATTAVVDPTVEPIVRIDRWEVLPEGPAAILSADCACSPLRLPQLGIELPEKPNRPRLRVTSARQRAQADNLG
jgi:hypothetical protein